MNEYENCRIVDIKRGTGNRSHYIYAALVNEKGELLISATLDYIVDALAIRLPGGLTTDNLYPINPVTTGEE